MPYIFECQNKPHIPCSAPTCICPRKYEPVNKEESMYYIGGASDKPPELRDDKLFYTLCLIIIIAGIICGFIFN